MSVYDLVLHPRLQLRTDTYNRLTPVQQLHVARHPNRPTFLDIALNITDKFGELHGDRAGEHPPACMKSASPQRGCPSACRMSLVSVAADVAQHLSALCVTGCVPADRSG